LQPLSWGDLILYSQRPIQACIAFLGSVLVNLTLLWLIDKHQNTALSRIKFILMMWIMGILTSQVYEEKQVKVGDELIKSMLKKVG